MRPVHALREIRLSDLRTRWRVTQRAGNSHSGHAIVRIR